MKGGVWARSDEPTENSPPKISSSSIVRLWGPKTLTFLCTLITSFSFLLAGVRVLKRAAVQCLLSTERQTDDCFFFWLHFVGETLCSKIAAWIMFKSRRRKVSQRQVVGVDGGHAESRSVTLETGAEVQQTTRLCWMLLELHSFG